MIVTTQIKSDIKRVWECFTLPEHITQWNFAAPEWHCPNAENDFKKGGKFSYRMEAKDGSFGFDFWGIYYEIVPYRKIAYTLGDNRKVVILFSENNGKVAVKEAFETENENPEEMQRRGWKMILDNFKKHVEKL